jgi:hypothetical protein
MKTGIEHITENLDEIMASFDTKIKQFEDCIERLNKKFNSVVSVKTFEEFNISENLLASRKHLAEWEEYRQCIKYESIENMIALLEMKSKNIGYSSLYEYYFGHPPTPEEKQIGEKLSSNL